MFSDKQNSSLLIEQLYSFASFQFLVLDNETEDNLNESSDGGDLDHPGYYGDHHSWDSTSDVEKEKLNQKQNELDELHRNMESDNTEQELVDIEKEVENLKDTNQTLEWKKSEAEQSASNAKEMLEF